MTGTPFSGRVLGGQSPVKTSSIQIYSVGTSGYGSAATALLGTPATSDVNGNFSISASYTCPAGGLIYIVSTQGDSGSGNNANLALMSTLGVCPVTGVHVNIDEVTTVASVWALSPFMTGSTNIGSPSTTQALAGIAAAFTDVNTLANISTGNSPGAGAPAGSVVPTSTIYTLANALAACVNSAGGTAGQNNGCGNLFTAATSGAAPTDTITAAMNIAQHPATNIASIYALATPSSPFQPGLVSQPNDFSLAVTFTGNMNAPSALAADGSGNIWITNKTGNTVTELSQNGTLLSGTGITGSLNAPSAIAIDSGGQAWVTNKGNSTVSRLTSGGITGSSPYSGGGLNAPVGISFDSAGNAWVANSGTASMTKINSSGTTLTNYTPAGAAGPLAVGVNPH